MLVDFNILSQEARLWVYMSNREFTPKEQEYIDEVMTKFCTKWNHHKNDLRSGYRIVYNQFIVLAVDESYNEISGCSISKSIKLMQQLEKELNIELMNRLNTAFKDNGRIQIVDFGTFKELAHTDKIHPETIVFNNLTITKSEFEKKWEVPVSESWHGRFLNKK